MQLGTRHACSMAIALCGLGLTGCQPASQTARVPVNTPEMIAQRTQFQLADEPVGAVPLREIPDLFQSTKPDTESTAERPAADASSADVDMSVQRDVVFLARVGGPHPDDAASTPDFPFESGKATFFVSDLTTEQHDDGHDHHNHPPGLHDENCPYHGHEKATCLLALVRCLGADGQIVNVDARDLFSIAENDIVVIRGTAKMIGNTLVLVDAKGISVRR